jgi:tetratricopeptide (TPR) repeat protein
MHWLHRLAGMWSGLLLVSSLSFRLAAQDDPRLLEALRIAQEGSSDSARALVAALLQQTPPTDSLYPQVLYTMGLVSRSVDDMRRTYSQVAIEYANSSWADDALYRLALLDYAAGDLPGAVRQLERVRSDYPDSPLLGTASEWAARSLFGQKKPREACAWLAMGVEHAGEDVELRNRLEFLRGPCAALPDSSQVAAAPTDTTPTPVKDTTPATPARTGVGVQVAAVNTQGAADKVAHDLKAAGFTPYVVREGALFKVRAGPYPDRAKALTAAEQIRKKLGHSPFLVKEP